MSEQTTPEQSAPKRKRKKKTAVSNDEGIEFTPEADNPWLYRRKVGLQHVAIVVLKDLPLNPMYYEWLRLAPTDSIVWKELVKIAFRQQDLELLKDL
jgi:hypothetical protein